MKEYTIFDSYNTTDDAARQVAKENILDNMFFDSDVVTVTDNYGKEVSLTRKEYAASLTEEQILQECYDLSELWFNDELSELKYHNEGTVLAIADLGRWNGRFSGYKELKDLPSVMYSSCDYERVYVDSNGDLRKEESHHDGSNSILYRYWKDNITDAQKENFLNKIYNGKCTQKDISRYTRKAGVSIANAFGWTVRGGENKYKK